MKTNYIIIFALLFSWSSYAQENQPFSPGNRCKIYALITDNTTKDTLRRVTVEFMDKDYNRIKTTRSDFDGFCILSVCSKQLINDMLLVKTTKPFYKQEISYYKITSDSVININMTLDKNKTITKAKFEEYNKNTLYFDCEVVRDSEVEYETNKTYHNNCTGEDKTYQDLIKDKEIFSEWVLLKK